jgi:hypothetical protein
VSGAAAYLTARDAGGSIEETDGNYRITIPRLEPGSYAICHDAKCVPVFVPRLGKVVATLVD